jgi:GAF domain-containing protein
VTVVGDRGTDLHQLGATGSWARELSAVDVLVPGPAELALHGAVPVVAERLDDHADLWPAYVEAVADIGLAAVAAYPLAIGGRPFGVLTLYRGDPEARATHGEEMEAAMFAELAVTAVLADSGRTGDPPNLGEGGGTSILVGAAARSLSIRQTIGFDTALSRLRMHALLNGQSTLSVAQQVLRRELPRID